MERSFYEYHALVNQGRWSPNHVPKVYHYDDILHLTIMQYLSPHIILRKALIANGPMIFEHTLVDKESKSILFIEENEVLPNGERIEGSFAALNTIAEENGQWYFSGTYLYPDSFTAQEVAQNEQMFLQTYENMIAFIKNRQVDLIHGQLFKYN